MIPICIRKFLRWLLGLSLRLLAFITGAPPRPVEVIYVHGSDSDEDEFIKDDFIDDEFIEVYPTLRGFDVLRGRKKMQCQQLIDQFHDEVQPDIRTVIRNNRFYEIRLKKTRFGIGVFNGGKRAITKRPKAPLAVYFCAISTEAQYARDRDFTYGFGGMTLCGVECVLDGKFTVSKEKPYNGVFFNHSCTPNCYALEITEEETGIKYLLFYPSKRIELLEELTIDYNEGIERDEHGNELRQGYWSDMKTLNIPIKYLVKCECNGGECPKNRGFDLRYMRPKEAAKL